MRPSVFGELRPSAIGPRQEHGPLLHERPPPLERPVRRHAVSMRLVFPCARASSRSRTLGADAECSALAGCTFRASVFPCRLKTARKVPSARGAAPGAAPGASAADRFAETQGSQRVAGATVADPLSQKQNQESELAAARRRRAREFRFTGAKRLAVRKGGAIVKEHRSHRVPDQAPPFRTARPGAEGGTRTPTGSLPYAPQAHVSTIPPLRQR